MSEKQHARRQVRLRNYMKKHAGKLLLLLLAALLVFALAACNDNPGNTGNNGGTPGGDTPTPATHTVHFDAGGGQDLGTQFDVEVTHGGTVEYPTLANGDRLVPLRPGYTFTGWVDEDDNEFIFSDTAEDGDVPTAVTDDVTVTATWTATAYTHTLVTSANSADYPYGGDAANGEWTYSGSVALKRAEDAEVDPTFVTQYGSKKPVGDIPVVTTDVEGDWFVYWYYITVDSEGVVTEVPFTEWADADGTAPEELASEYDMLTALTLYPKMHSQLPDYTLTFGGYGDALTAKLNDSVAEGAVADPVREGYVFDGWYYYVTTGEGDDAVTVEREFVFAAEAEEGETDLPDPTLLTAAIGTEGEDGGYTLELHAKWVRSVTVTSAADLESFRTELDAALAGEDELEKYALLHADITFAEGAAFTLTDFVPLYDGDDPFAGTLNGNGASVTLNYTASYTGSVYALIGGSEGTLTDLTAVISVAALGATESSDILIGLIGVSSGSVGDVTVTLTAGSPSARLQAEGKRVYVGAIAARLGGGSVTDCTVKSARIYVTAAGLYAGGAAGACLSYSSVSSSEVEAFTIAATASDAYVGGFVGSGNYFNATECGVRSSDINVTADAVRTGGFAGSALRGEITVCFADSYITVNAARTGRAGGIAGRSMSLIANSRAVTHISVNATANGAQLYAGGVAGDSTRVSMSASSSSSATGDINASYGGGTVTVDAGGYAASVYAGGVAGRMTNMRSERSFTDADITVTGSALTSARVNAFIGAAENTVTLSGCYYATDIAVTLNGETAEAVTRTGVSGTESAHYTDEEWLTDNDGLNLEGSLWHATPDGPRLDIEDPDAAE